MFLFSRYAVIIVAIAASTVLAKAASIDVYLSAPGQQSTFVGSALTETFDGYSTGNKNTPLQSVIGIYQLTPTSQINISNANQYGGANGTRFMAFGAQSGTGGAITLDLDAHHTYFGFWWSAGDPFNGITLYHNDLELARVSTSEITSLLAGATVTAIDGSVYDTALYRGNPNTGENVSQNYAYVSIVVQGAAFNRIQFDNGGLTTSGFESDNHSIYFGNVTVPGDAVWVGEIQGIPDVVIPEPAASMLVAAGLAMLALRWRGRTQADRA